MHLRSLRLRGFKSFPDTLELKLEPGVAVVVGPNGSGKSNVADAIVWAAGSLTPSELRAEKPDDVLFNGAEGRTPAESCEVELVFDNESGGFGELDFSEVSIARRLHRGGEGQYLVNRAQVRRTDLVELLADVGLGGSMHSIVSQGKVEAVLASKPEERRELVEEAAGLGKFKRRQHRAELKLNRVGIQVERARDVEAEVRKRLRPLALQATAAERAEKLADEIAGLRARIAELDLAAADARRVAAEERKTAAGIGRRSAQEKLTALLAERHAAEEELADAAGKREAAIKALYRLQGATERIALRQEGAQSLLAGCAAISARPRRPRARSRTSRRASSSGRRPRRPRPRGRRPLRGRRRCGARACGPGAARRRSSAQLPTRAEERLEALRRERQAIEAELADAAGGREGATAALYRLGTAPRADRDARRVRLGAARARPRRAGRVRRRREAAGPVAGRARGSGERRGGRGPRPLRTRATTSPSARRSRRSGSRRSSARWPSARGLRLPRGCSRTRAPSWRSRCSTSRPAQERAVAAALGWGASAVVADDAAAGLALLQRARDAGLGSLAVLVGKRPAERVAELPVVALDELLSATVPSVTGEGFGYDPQRGELWFAGEAAEAVLLELETRRRALAAEVEELQAQAGAAEIAAAQAAEAAEQAEAAYAQVAHLRGAARCRSGAAAPHLSGADRLDEALLAAVAVAARLEQPLRARPTRAPSARESWRRACARRRPRARGARGRRRRRTSAPALRS